ncbi:MAG: methylated-DNA--[protein]-cysteine S-methyltransferase [Burkholderiales bacterium]
MSEIVFLPKATRIRDAKNQGADMTCEQLRCYLADADFRFSVKLKVLGTEHQRAVWSQMRQIRAGRTKTYGEVAAIIKSSARAVGQACGANPIPIIIPCHRIVASGGLGGFAHQDVGFPLNVKRWLLLHEHARW